MEQEQLRKAQLIQLEIAKEIKSVCETNGIKYSLAYGTLIGAVRHKGFIPWDDDLDIIMIREEYEKFISACKSGKLNDKYFLQSFDTDPFYTWPYIKIQKKGTVYKESYANEHSQNGIFVDVFPLDVAPKHRWQQRYYSFMHKAMIRMLQIKMGFSGFLSNGWKQRCMYSLLAIASKTQSVEHLKTKMYNYEEKYTNKSNYRSNLVYCLNGTEIIAKEVFDASIFNDYIEIEFEGVPFMVAKDYDKFLRTSFGDYMILPPEEERVNRHQIVEFSDCENSTFDLK